MSLSPPGGPDLDLGQDGTNDHFGVYMFPAEDLTGHAWTFVRQGRIVP